MDWTELAEPIAQVLMAIIALFGTSGYWAWRKLLLARKDKDDFKESLIKQVGELVKKIDELNKNNNDLLREVYSLRSSLSIAQKEITGLNAVLAERYKEMKNDD